MSASVASYTQPDEGFKVFMSDSVTSSSKEYALDIGYASVDRSFYYPNEQSNDLERRKLSFFVSSTGDLVDKIPFTQSEFSVDGELHRFKSPLELTIVFDTDTNFYVIDNDIFNINVYAEAIDELLEELSEELAFLWCTYAQGNSDNMTSQAIELKNRLLSAID